MENKGFKYNRTKDNSFERYFALAWNDLDNLSQLVPTGIVEE